jgi:hypothetical protein
MVAFNDPSVPPIPWCPSCEPPAMVAFNDPSVPPIPWCPSCEPPAMARA